MVQFYFHIKLNFPHRLATCNEKVLNIHFWPIRKCWGRNKESAERRHGSFVMTGLKILLIMSIKGMLFQPLLNLLFLKLEYVLELLLGRICIHHAGPQP